MASYYTTVKVVNKNGEVIKAEINCGGKARGYTDERTGEIGFELASKDMYDVSAKRYGDKIYGKVKGGGDVTLKFKK